MIPNYYNMKIDDFLNEIEMSRKEYEVPDYFIERFNKKMHEAIKNDIREIRIPIKKNMFDFDSNRLRNLGKSIEHKMRIKFPSDRGFLVFYSSVFHTIEIHLIQQ